MPTRISYKIPLILFAGIALLVPLFFTWSTYESFYLPKLFLLESLIVLLCLSMVPSYLFHKMPEGVFPRGALWFFLPFVAYVIWCGLSLLRDYNPYSIQGYFLLVSQVCVSFFAVCLVRDDESRLLIFRAMLIAAFIASAIGIAQYFGLRYEKGFQWIAHGSLEKMDIYSTSGNPNFLGAYLIGVLPLAFLCSLGRLDGSIGWRWFYRVTTLAMLLCLLYTRTKGAWIGAGIALLYLLILQRSSVSARIAQGRILVILGCAVVILGLGLYISGTIDWIIEEIRSLRAGHVTIRGRLFLWQVTIGMISDHLFTGVGWGNYRAYFQEYQGRFLEAHPDYVTILDTQGSAESSHNEYLEITAETGLLGLLLFFLVLGVTFRLVARAKDMESDSKRGMTYAAAAGILAIMVHSLFVFPLHLVDAGTIFWMQVGLIHAMNLKDIDPSQIKRTPGNTAVTLQRVVVIIGCALLSCLLIFTAFRPVMASVYHKKAWEAMARGNFPSTILYAETGRSWSSLNDELYLLSGAAKYQMGMVQASIEDYKKAYEIYPDYMILYNVGLSYKRLGMLDEAADYFRKAVFVRPNLKEAYVEVLGILRTRGDAAEEAAVRARMRKMGVL